ncbi:hypothetical protein SAY87_012475 [Trapa incisa]|uniref:FAF domain-containing protein n=1 Tax=Trapa incisa TaxID=236973 RepID=A0AAN7GSP3_9MYRT|nr:hypothetical protein SAY87_012475 [Trapa incisa]
MYFTVGFHVELCTNWGMFMMMRSMQICRWSSSGVKKSLEPWHSLSHRCDSAVQPPLLQVPNMVESNAVYSHPSPTRKEPSGFGLMDDIGGGVVDGLMSCTESLGFESSGDLWSDQWYPDRPAKPVERTRWREESERRREKKFPPPISSLNHKGQRSFFLRPVRTEGRLELTEVRIDRPSEILRASREDGRLKLDLIVDEDMEVEEQEQEKEEEAIEGGDGENEDDLEEGQTPEERHEVGEWMIAMSSEGFGRCHEAVNHRHNHHHHRHNLQDVWRQPCVPTR